MPQNQTDLSTLQANAEVFFRSYGLSFSDGMTALLEDWEKTPSKETQAAIDELESGGGVRCKNLQDFYRPLHEEG